MFSAYMSKPARILQGTRLEPASPSGHFGRKHPPWSFRELALRGFPSYRAYWKVSEITGACALVSIFSMGAFALLAWVS